MECSRCKKAENLKRCTGCYQVSYCSRVCQKSDWRDHQKACKNATLSSVTSHQKTNEQKLNSGDMTEEKKKNEASSKAENVAPEESTITKCRVCEKVSCQKCSRCKNVFYCSKTCQKADWKRHKSDCPKPGKNYESARASDSSHARNFPFGAPFGFPPFFPFFPFQQSMLEEILSIRATTTEDKYNEAIMAACRTFPACNIISLLSRVPRENPFFPFMVHMTYSRLVAFIPRYHHYRDRHCIYIEDKAGEETYVAFYLDYDNPFPFFSWNSVRPGRFICIESPCIHYFMDGSVGFRIEDASEVAFIDV